MGKYKEGPKAESEIKNALDIRFECFDLGEELTVREWLKTLLRTLWEEDEGFNSKYPFGSDGWKSEIAELLIDNGYMAGYLERKETEPGVSELVELEYDEKDLERIGIALIDAL
uniref:Uncharacterized protein n=1 Tax=Candidatus Kentrum sp. UNK TaxID=2126344 RepID=A0A451AQK7_9GAMM|nr:MAG: hypothetical protein BECKUNK1418G_GA0071005_100268 [Candidatus Kentron sp. UNK]VFK68341.1 MAG: hypothetical protein BECKUNK1418H_GA0071006_100168 [Candidatus Kentron sp. UNK]